MKPYAFVTAENIFNTWQTQLMQKICPPRYKLGDGAFKNIEIGPGLVTLFGGAPGAGKTALIMQGAIDGLRMDSELRVLVANVEMSPEILLERQLARLSGMDLTCIRDRLFEDQDQHRLHTGLNTMAGFVPRLAFMRPPYDVAHLTRCCEYFQAHLLVVDYVQRFGCEIQTSDTRARINEIMSRLRQLAERNVAVLVVSAVGRSRDQWGRTSYDGGALSLASFRESSELEYGADDAYLLHPAPVDPEKDLMALRHLKSRHGACQDRLLRFDRPRQHFCHIEQEVSS